MLGAAGFERQTQDNLKLKLAWDFTPETHLMVTIGRFGNDTQCERADLSSQRRRRRNLCRRTVQYRRLFVHDPRQYFSNNVYVLDEQHWMRSVSLDHRGDNLDMRLVTSDYDYDRSQQRAPSVAPPAAFTGGRRFDYTLRRHGLAHARRQGDLARRAGA
ncbi:MAG: hypothetical protein WDN76_10860 [Alphaproteobacteria bacterium]